MQLVSRPAGLGVCMQVLLAVPALRDFYILPHAGQQLRKGPIGSALQELVQTTYGVLSMIDSFIGMHALCRSPALLFMQCYYCGILPACLNQAASCMRHES